MSKDLVTPIRGFIVSARHRSVSSGAADPGSSQPGSESTELEFYGRLENGESFLVRQKFRPYFYVDREVVERVAVELERRRVSFDQQREGWTGFKPGAAEGGVLGDLRRVNEGRLAVGRSISW